MDYIRKQIEQRIDFLSSIEDKAGLISHHQSRFEYVLVYLLGYLWNKNIQSLDAADKEFVFQGIIKPTIGGIVSLCRKLDINKEILKNSKLNKAIEKYPSLRNEILGHGYSFEDSVDSTIASLDILYNSVLSANLPALSADIDLIYVLSIDDVYYKGINYKSDGSTYVPWSCHKDIYTFKVNSIYGSIGLNEYFRLSPFIEISAYGKEVYIFNSIDEKLLGKIRYNRLLETGILNKEWKEISELNIVEDGVKVKTSNGTILNVYKNNYNKYIDIGIKQKITDFLIKNKASVCATIWGHGGVGKTATIQSVCDDLANNERKIFDYIVFLSAKDRRYNFYTGNIEQINDSISSFDELIKSVNKVLFNSESFETQSIIDFQGKVLLVIDDFETFTKEEKDKIEKFILGLNINNHKIIITTRAANIKLGQEFQTNELTESETGEFIMRVIENENLGNEVALKRELQDNPTLHKIYEITSGRPLFIFQFAFIVGQKGIKDALNFNIKEGTTAIHFLYGRIYDYLSQKAKDLFVVLSLLVDGNDLVNVLEKAQYILNLENEPELFNSTVDELIKLKIIKFTDDENRFFEIYSNEIFQMMSDYFQKKENTFKRSCVSRRDQVNKDKILDIEHSLLFSANANRLAKNEIEVIESYKQIINRATSPLEIKLSAILNLSAYLVVDKGKKDFALKYLDDYSHFFKNTIRGDNHRIHYAMFTKMWATYNWANGTKSQKQKAIEILLEYAKTGFNYNNDIDIELAGMLLQYNSIVVISDWQDLKEQKRYEEISDNEFKQLRDAQKQVCKDIHDKQGVSLYNAISQKKLGEISSGARQNIIAGLYNFIEVLVRLQKVDLALEICEYIFYFAPKNFHLQFERKVEWLKQIQKQNNKYQKKR